MKTHTFATCADVIESHVIILAHIEPVVIDTGNLNDWDWMLQGFVWVQSFLSNRIVCS